MSEAGLKFNSLRHGRRENRRLLCAFGLSLAAHLLFWGGYQINQWAGWFHPRSLFARWHEPIPLVQPPRFQEPELLLDFLQAVPADPEPAPKPKLYASNISLAAHPEVRSNPDTPKLNNLQTNVNVPQTDTTHRIQPVQTQAPPQVRPAPKPTQPAPPPPSQLAVKEAHKQDSSHSNGAALRPAGGVQPAARQPAFGAKASQFGEYCTRFEQAVDQNWNDLLTEEHFSGDCKGTVILHFYLNYDGTLTDISTVRCTVDKHYALLCRQALTKHALFAQWSEEMRREIGENSREMIFTFNY